MALLAVGLAGGCQIGAFIGGMAASADRKGSRTVPAKYPRLENASFAVIVASDRSLQREQPDAVPLLTREITRRLSENCGASGMVPADEILRFQYQRPGWIAMSPGELASTLNVQRLVFIDLQEYALTEPGNPYVWNGTASGVVSVLEADSRTPDDFVFRENIRVHFPDSEGLSQSQVPRQTVELELARRFIHRSSWLFYDHDEANALKY